MKFTQALACALLGLAFAIPSKAQSGKGLVFNGINQSVQFPATGLPVGNTPRTLEFWVRATPETDQALHHIVNWGQPGDRGSAFGVTARNVGGKFCLGFWGDSRDSQFLVAPIPDEDWHFVALTYDGSQVRCYLDGEMRADPWMALNTAAGPLYIGNRAPISGHINTSECFDGCVRDIAVWSQARSQYQIQMDMVPWPAITGTEFGLVTYIPLNEGSGNTFSDKKKAVTGTIGGVAGIIDGASWSKPIPADPNPVDEGIWFLIQSKTELDQDTGVTAKRKALVANDDGTIAWAPVPLRGDYDRYLWRTVTYEVGKTHIVNKKFGKNSALQYVKPVQGNPRLSPIKLSSFEDHPMQFWIIEQANLQNWGTNVYTFGNIVVSDLWMSDRPVPAAVYRTAMRNEFSDGWVLQPMQLAMGYHIPAAAAAVFPMNNQLNLPYGFKLNGSTTTSNWAMLNAHLIYKNMLMSLTDDAANSPSKDSLNSRLRQIIMISQYDQNRFAFQYPLLRKDNWDEKELSNIRGGARTQTLVTEEMMGRRGVVSKGYTNNTYREFDQVIHEFGHSLDNLIFMRSNFPQPYLGGILIEGVAAAVQSWFNNNYSYPALPRTRVAQRAQQIAQYGHLQTFFRDSNTWMPPRWLRDQPGRRVELGDGDTLKVADWIYSTPPYGPAGVFAKLNPDGNLAIYSNDEMVYKWSTIGRLGIPMDSVKYIVMSGGILRMKSAANKDVYVSTNAPTSGARLVVAKPLPESPNSWIRIVNDLGLVIWEPDGLMELKNGDTMFVGNHMYSSAGVAAKLNPDGNLVVYISDDKMTYQWDAITSLKIPINMVRYAVMENGILRMKDASGNDVYTSTNTPANGVRLIIAPPLASKPNSWIRIVDAAGALIWSP